MTRLVLAAALLLTATLQAQDATLEYRVKAAYLFNFARFVEWPAGALGSGPFRICVAGRNPFGTTLDETVRGEQISGLSIAVSVILEPEPGCQIIFIPRGAATPAYLRAAHDTPVLTVGEIDGFIGQGGMINFVLEGNNVRFEIDSNAAHSHGLRISSRLLRLARPVP